MVILVIGGYQWLSVVISVIDNNFHIFQDNGYRWLSNVYLKSAMVILVIDGYLWLLMCISTVQWLSWLLNIPHYPTPVLYSRIDRELTGVSP